jgi:hypothetical protein
MQAYKHILTKMIIGCDATARKEVVLMNGPLATPDVLVTRCDFRIALERDEEARIVLNSFRLQPLEEGILPLALTATTRDPVLLPNAFAREIRGLPSFVFPELKGRLLAAKAFDAWGDLHLSVKKVVGDKLVEVEDGDWKGLLRTGHA